MIDKDYNLESQSGFHSSKHLDKTVLLIAKDLFDIKAVLSISTDGRRKASATLLREASYFSSKFK